MKKFVTYYVQSGGCDYTIACGEKLGDVFEAENMDEALKAEEKHLRRHYRDRGEDEDELPDRFYETIAIYEVTGETGAVDLEALSKVLKSETKEREKREEETKERTEFERLKQKFDKGSR